MNIKWLVQDVGKTQMLNDNFLTLKNLNEDCYGFGLINGLDTVTNLENILIDTNDIYILRGGTKIISLFEKYDNITYLNDNLNSYQKENGHIFFNQIKNGIFYNLNSFDQQYYSKLNLPLLNKQAIYLPINKNLNKSFSEDLFIKPSQDLKAFLPGILNAGQTIEKFIKNSQHISSCFNDIALISKLKKIKQEYRFFVVNKKVITGSLYKNEDKIIYDSYIPTNIKEHAIEFANLYQPHDIFTMDLAILENNDIKIVEYNCFNGSGLYNVDKELLFSEVKNFVKNKYINI